MLPAKTHGTPEVSDIERIRILHDLSSFFKIDEATIGLLKQQLDSSLRDQIGRFFQGYSTEQSFQLLFAFLPWVKMIHGLAQLQLCSVRYAHDTRADRCPPGFWMA